MYSRGNIVTLFTDIYSRLLYIETPIHPSWADVAMHVVIKVCPGSDQEGGTGSTTVHCSTSGIMYKSKSKYPLTSTEAEHSWDGPKAESFTELPRIAQGHP